MIEKVISGGQTGADIGGLRAARAAGIPTGGWAARDWMMEAGPAPWLEGFGLVCECISDGNTARSYRVRTRLNVLDSDATLWFGDPLTPGGRATRADCSSNGKPIVVVESGVSRPSMVVAFLNLNPHVVTINCAGNRESKFPGIGKRVEEFLGEVFRRLR